MVDDEGSVGVKLFKNGTGRLRLSVPVSAPVHGRMPENLPVNGQRITGDRPIFFDIGNRFAFQFGEPRKIRTVRAAALPVL